MSCKDRSSTLDWVEFRDILFPMVSGRYTEQHIRKLFNLFDLSGDGHLSVQEIAGKNPIFRSYPMKKTVPVFRIT